ncbi:Bug family tripartite tricarboxylate transporter substrate binding protein [Bordetella genomosp. 11]|uniref:MFS transporter n=1 Tax=Bordetella genomosp. 11 TaxID=1416808 RepID=A0A261UZM8_9BORD|nr:tripartite tricarboxylate transporter substrate binding protein [Bordetella genomosp. 11]OZI66740.1 MFS transporter [Bordetella genomosp. 11]
MKLLRTIAGAVCLLLSLSAHAADPAESYPDRQIRIVVPYPPGGFNDTLGRTAAEYLGTHWKTSVVVDNRPGGNTLIGNTIVARAAPDGYTLLVTPLPFSALPGLYQDKMPYDAVKDFAPVIWAGSTQNALVVRADSKYKTVQDVIDDARKNPGKINYASTGSGSSNHLSMALFDSMTGVKMTHIPYKGSAPAVTALLGGDTDMLFDNVPNVYPQIEAGKLRALATTGLKRSPMLPDIPTVDESGVRGYEVTVWFGIQAPAGTPKPIVEKLNRELGRMLQDPAVRERFAKQGVQPVGGTPEQFAQQVSTEIKKWGDLIQRADIKIQ